MGVEEEEEDDDGVPARAHRSDPHQHAGFHTHTQLPTFLRPSAPLYGLLPLLSTLLTHHPDFDGDLGDTGVLRHAELPAAHPAVAVQQVDVDVRLGVGMGNVY